MLAETLYQTTREKLQTIFLPSDGHPLTAQEELEAYKHIYKEQFECIKKAHDNQEGGLAVAQARSALLDALLECLYTQTLLKHPTAAGRFSLIALGGYGRGYLNPYSDVDLLFLTKKASHNLPESLSQALESILYPLWDMGFKVGHATRNQAECLAQAKTDTHTLTALLEARFLQGDADYFAQFQERFNNQIVHKRKKEYLISRMEDLENRHKKYSYTVFLQEPNIKESPGGLRDYQNILWASRVTLDCQNPEDLVKNKLIGRKALYEITESIDFMHRVRNELHFQAHKASDILTLRAQGLVADAQRYPQDSILTRTEAFMREYYQHARAIEDRLQSVLEILDLAQKKKKTLISLLPFRWKKRERMEGFLVENGLLYPESLDIFEEEPSRLMQLFQICQVRGLELSPPLRGLIKNSLELIHPHFQSDPSIIEIFQAILERKGNVAPILRMMHRVGVLGRFLPEFGALDCLVQHEFYHRYTADEHTLRCIEQLDALFSDKIPTRSHIDNIEVFRKIFRDQEDPFALYLALLLHDTGRSTETETHTEGSTLLANQACKRLGILGSRRRLILFLVDNHLAFWRCATTRNIDDVEVLAEFAGLVKSQAQLEALYLFTFADSLGTNEEAWSSWKESLMLQLYKNTLSFFEKGDTKAFLRHLDKEAENLKQLVQKRLGLSGEEAKQIKAHLQKLPPRYFRFRKIESVLAHLEIMKRFEDAQSEAVPPSYAALWRPYPEKGYTEFVITAQNQPFFLEKLCCALASEQLNILSAEIFTRQDGQILDILRLCTLKHEHVSDQNIRQRVEKTFSQLQFKPDYNPSEFLQRKKNYLLKTPEGFGFPVSVQVRNDLTPLCTVIEIQAYDRIGLLHDVFHTLGELKLDTVNAKIATEKGAALDTIYVTTPEGQKIEDPELLALLEERLKALVMTQL